MKIYLDDIRYPLQTYPEDNQWLIARNYIEFILLLEDFINVITKREINRYENDISAGKGDTLDGIPMAGRSFVKYDVVKKLGVYPEKKILQFEEKLQKVKVI